MTFEIDPLLAKNASADAVALSAIKREIVNILDSYVGWFDPFSELIQNALDAVDANRSASKNRKGLIRVIIDLSENCLTVTDNGTGLTKDQFEKFLAPSFSFKSGKTRGYKGVGATYLAYGFNEIQIATKSAGFSAHGYMVGGRNWLSDENPSGNPKLVENDTDPFDDQFDSLDSGTSVTVFFDEDTRPGKLSWLSATTAEQWEAILTLKTGLGCIPERDDLTANIEVIDVEGNATSIELDKLSYCWPHQFLRKTKSVLDIKMKDEALFKKHGAAFNRPSQFRNLDAIHATADNHTIGKLIELDEEEKEFFEKHSVFMYVCFTHSTKIWDKLNEQLDIRSGQNMFGPGIQIAANNMPQGETYIVPLTKNIGRQRQLHFVYHLEGVRSDLGRKGFQKEIVSFLQAFSSRFFRQTLQKYFSCLKPASGAPPDLERTHRVEEWKKEFEQHESNFPLILDHEAFFLPKKKISITSRPTREQDVVSLFNQLLAGGVIRGIQIMSTNERFTYDSMYRIAFGDNPSIYIFDAEENPLGIDEDNFKENFVSHPKILEYKFDLDGLIEDIEGDEKNTNDIDMLVCWSVGDQYKANYDIVSLLDEENIGDRVVHGVTHALYSSAHNQKEMDLIVLEDLISFLNDPAAELERQVSKYED